MKFTVSTAPLKSGLNLGIVNSNVTKFYPQSMVVQLTADRESLKINLGAISILSEIRLRGVGDDEYGAIIIDNMQLKQLIGTISAPQIDLEFTKNALVIHAGKSTYTLPKIMDVEDAQFPRPRDVSPEEIDTASELSKDDWKFIKEHQMYARGTSTSNPVYTYVWVGKSGDVLVSDYINGLFTHSSSGNFDDTCLLQETVINLLNALPDGAKLVHRDGVYYAVVITDSYEYIAEFSPQHESEEIGNYNAPIIMNMMFDDERPVSIVSVADITTVLNQSSLLTSDKEPELYLTVDDDCIIIKDSNVNCVIPASGVPNEPYTIKFASPILKQVISKCSETTIEISPVVNDGVVSGIVIGSNNLTVAVAGKA